MEGRDLKAHSGLRADFCWGFCFCEFIPAGSPHTEGLPKGLGHEKGFLSFRSLPPRYSQAAPDFFFPHRAPPLNLKWSPLRGTLHQRAVATPEMRW